MKNHNERIIDEKTGEFKEFPQKEIDRAKRVGRLNREITSEPPPETIRRKKKKKD